MLRRQNWWFSNLKKDCLVENPWGSNAKQEIGYNLGVCVLKTQVVEEKIKITRPCDWRVTQLFEWELLVVCQHHEKFG